jgi:hypothetical protein
MTTLALHDRAASPRSGVVQRLWGAWTRLLARRAVEREAFDPAQPLPGAPPASAGLLETALLLRN